MGPIEEAIRKYNEPVREREECREAEKRRERLAAEEETARRIKIEKKKRSIS